MLKGTQDGGGTMQWGTTTTHGLKSPTNEAFLTFVTTITVHRISQLKDMIEDHFSTSPT